MKVYIEGLNLDISDDDYHKLVLVEFWKKFGSDKRVLLSYLPEEETISNLIEMCSYVLPDPYLYGRRIARRRKFEKQKIRKLKRIEFSNCFVCWDKAQVRHHIIPLQNGGRNYKINIIGLCHNCHGKIHPWLIR